jgi:hypothetical protein
LGFLDVSIWWIEPMTDDTTGEYHDTASRVHGGRIDRDKLRWLRALLDDNVSLAKAFAEIHQWHFEGHTAASTVEALMLGLRERGVAALKEAPVQERLGELPSEQLREVLARLIRLRPKYPKITDKLLLRLEDLLP